LALSVLRCLAQIPGLRTSLFATDPWVPTRFSRYRSQFLSPRQAAGDDGRLATICHTVKHTNADVILPVDEQAIRFVSVHEGTLPQWTAVAPVPATASFDIARDKWLLAGWLTAHEIPCPPTLVHQCDEAFDQGLSTLPFPVLIKPTQDGYGRGIRRFETPSALWRFFHEHVCSEAFIVQSFIRYQGIRYRLQCLVSGRRHRGLYHPTRICAGLFSL
jgi:glutathione synthase/RimK-type ligase-like ATP-grasp enzyme